jgi:hypothetical protein
MSEQQAGLTEIPSIDGWTSPRLNVRFANECDGLVLWGRSGPFLTIEDRIQARRRAEAMTEREQNSLRQLHETIHRMAEKLRSLGIDPDAI